VNKLCIRKHRTALLNELLIKPKRYLKDVRSRNTGTQTHTPERGSDNNFTKHKFWVIYCPLRQERFRYSCTAIPLLFCTAPASNEALITSCDELLYSLSISVRVLLYLLSCRNFFHFATVFKFLTSKISLQRWKQMTIALRCIPRHNQISVGFCYQIRRKGNLFPDLSSRTNLAPLTRDILGWADGPFH
jgi:hypothetical protein